MLVAKGKEDYSQLTSKKLNFGNFLLFFKRPSAWLSDPLTELAPAAFQPEAAASGSITQFQEGS